MGRRTCGEEVYGAALLAAASYRLPGARRPFPTEPLPGPEWSALVVAADDHRVIGQLAAAVGGGAFPATAEQAGEIRAAHRGQAMRVLELEGHLVALVELLTAADIEHRVLKGPAVARLDHADPSCRTYIDLDVLVRAGDVDRTVALLTAAGFERTLAEPRRGFDRRFDKGTTLIPPSDRYELDLHRTFVLGPWGSVIDLDQLWEGSEEFRVGGRPVPALARPARFLHACYHAALGNWPLRLGSLRDVAELLRAPGPDAAAVHRLARSWGAEAVMAAAVVDARRLLGTDGPDELSRWAAGFVPSRRDESWLALHTRSDKTFAAQALATLRHLPRWRDRVAYVRALIRPDAAYTADRHGSALGRFRYAFVEARRGRSGSGHEG